MEQTTNDEKPAGAASELTDVLEAKRLRYCSFCGCSEAERDYLVAADGDVFICDRCVEICRDVIGHGREMKRLMALEAKASNAIELRGEPRSGESSD